MTFDFIVPPTPEAAALVAKLQRQGDLRVSVASGPMVRASPAAGSGRTNRCRVTIVHDHPLAASPVGEICRADLDHVRQTGV
jgi:hypothetical protein